ncbi:YdbH domain-containing protein [Sphingomonas montana]|uniref:YdbH domain-containing protein n=1 Tax=Sphingomonas montana TaxID=1843236 RepID=UPI0009FB7D17|nr:YdbH domain-containing protein [Sphingomonas montana]
MDAPPARRRSRVRIAVAAASGLIALAIAGVWTQRKDVAAHYIDAELARRGVTASYTIARFGIGGQRLENIRIGDPARPDLTADHADIRIAIGHNGPYVASIAAGRVRLRGRLVDGRVTLGAVDRLLPAPSGQPFALPDLRVALDDAAIRLETAGGVVGFGITGSGRLSDGFSGRMAVAAPDLRVAGCLIRQGRAHVNLAITARRPVLDGPVAADGVTCGDRLTITRPAATVDVALSAALDRWTGGAFVDVAQVRSGSNRIDRMAGRVGFDGTAKGTQGTLAVVGHDVVTAAATARRIRFDGRYGVGPATRIQGDLRLTDGGVAAETRTAIAAAGRAGGGTPLAPVLTAMTTAAARATAQFQATATIDYAPGGRAAPLRIGRLTADAASGARLVLTEGAGLTVDPTTGGTRLDGRVRLAGGGLPTVDATVRQAGVDTPITGTMRIARYAAGGATLDLTPVRFQVAPGATRFDTVATMTGPVASGTVTSLRLPVTGRLGRGGSFVVDPECVPLAFDRLVLSGLTVGATRTTLCPNDIGLLSRAPHGRIAGGGRIAGPVLAGTLGGSPVRIAAGAVAFDIAGPDFTADALSFAIGPAADPTMRIAIDRFAGDFVTGGVGGRFAGLSGRIMAVPLLLTEGIGRWRLMGGALSVDSDAVTVSDAQADPRFVPLLSRDFALALRENRIVARGRLQTPTDGVAVADVAIRHDLTRGAGTARLIVPGLRFDPAFQPERLTRLTLGVVANVKGVVTGEGNIAWNRQGVTSTGRFGTESMDLAAAFGPVTGLKTELMFDDLLNLRTAPGQIATVVEINPGIAVRDGVVRYRLLPDRRVQVEGGRWPFSNGELTLEPTLLDFSGATERRMTFRIVGMDAAQFVQQFGFENIAVTGTFDGVLPMTFDDRGGRIAGGRLSVRPGGGTLAYVGEISNAKLGRFGALAFDALKRMRYRDLTILLDGALDGELVSKVVFDGTNQTPKEAIRRNGLLSSFANLPFRFNIVIKAPFRALLNSAQSLNDPRGLIRQAMPPPAEILPGSAPVQPKESEPVR